MKKEELQKKIGELESKNERLKNNDEYIRQEFAKAGQYIADKLNEELVKIKN